MPPGAPQPAPDRQIFDELLKLTRMVGETNTNVASLQAALDGFRDSFDAYVLRVDGHIQRLYAQDKQMTADRASCAEQHDREHQELRAELRTSAQASRSWKDRLHGAWWVVIAIGNLLLFLSNLAVAYYGGHVRGH